MPPRTRHKSWIPFALLGLTWMLGTPVSAESTLPKLEAAPAGPEAVILRWDALEDSATIEWRPISADWASKASKTVSSGTGVLRVEDLSPDSQYVFRLVKGDKASKSTEVTTPSRAAALLQSECYRAVQNDEKLADCSHVMISAIKTITSPDSVSNDDDWFSVQLKFGGNEDTGRSLRDRTFGLYFLDLNVAPDDGEPLVDDFMASTNLLFSLNDPHRGTFFSVAHRVVDGVGFSGLGLGGIERVSSDFFGSYVTAGLFLPHGAEHWNDESGGWLKDAVLLFDFSLRSDRGPAFFRALAVRGTVIVPTHPDTMTHLFEDRASDPESPNDPDDMSPVASISLLVPIGGVHGFR